MDLFPTCRFSVLVPDGVLRTGQRNEGTLELALPEDVLRAEHIDLTFRSDAIAGYGSGKSRTVLTRTMFMQPLRVDLTSGLRAGVHRFPFVLDLPYWLPRAYVGADCSIRHHVDLRLDVDWAIDPTASLQPNVVMAPLGHTSRRAPVAARSPAGFHDDVAIELQLDSGIVRQNEPVTGEIALRTGHAAEFGAVIVSLVHVARVTMGRNDPRSCTAVEVRIPAEQLRSGRSVRFRLPEAALPVTNRNNYLDLSSFVRVALDVSWWTVNRTFELGLEVLPEGSPVVDAGGSSPALLGETRMRRIAEELAARAGLRVGEAPTLVEGREGMVAFAVEDGSRGAECIAVEVFTFPDLRLGTRSRPLGILPVGGSLAPPPFDARFAIKCTTEAVPDDTLRAFFARVLEDADHVERIEVGDHRVVVRRAGADDPAWWLDVTVRARSRAKAIASAIASLPSRVADANARAAWMSTATEESAHLLPHLPAIHGIRRTVRTASGEQRGLVCSIETVVDGDATATRVDVDLDAPLPAHAIPTLHEGEPADDLVRALRATFPRIEAPSPEHVAAIAPGFARDPRPVLATLDTLLAWVLRARGERRVDAPYR